MCVHVYRKVFVLNASLWITVSLTSLIFSRNVCRQIKRADYTGGLQRTAEAARFKNAVIIAARTGCPLSSPSEHHSASSISTVLVASAMARRSAQIFHVQVYEEELTSLSRHVTSLLFTIMADIVNVRACFSGCSTRWQSAARFADAGLQTRELEHLNALMDMRIRNLSDELSKRDQAKEVINGLRGSSAGKCEASSYRCH